MPAGSSLVPVASSPLPTPASATSAAPGPPAPRSVDARESAPGNDALGDRIAEAAACIQAATYELLVLIRQFDERDGWEGFASCAHWLSWRIGLAPGAAREHVRVARALADLPRLSAAMQRGAVSYSKVRAVTRVAAPETEQVLLDVALAGTAAHVEHESRALHTWVDDDGMVVVRGRLTPEVGAVLRRALDAALDAAPSPVDPDGAAEDAADGMAPTIAQRRADALGALAECALAGGLDKGTAGDRYQVVVHVDADTLAAEDERPAAAENPASSKRQRCGHGDRRRPRDAGGQYALDEAGGIHVSAATARRLACDAAKVTMRHGPSGNVPRPPPPTAPPPRPRGGLPGRPRHDRRGPIRPAGRGAHRKPMRGILSAIDRSLPSSPSGRACPP